MKDMVKIVHFIATSEGYQPIDPPVSSNQLICQFCGCDFGYSPAADIDASKRVWICGRACERSKLKKDVGATYTPPTSIRELEWLLFCENNAIGNQHYGVKFENIDQSHTKITYMLKFATAPRGFILMQGDPGTGKTYAAMAMCELFTRKSASCVFTTQKQMASNWLNSMGDHMNTYVSHICNISLLVIDDFGTGEPNPKFLEFFMDVINARMQWDNRGTVITTNLKPEKFALFCGEALTDRINMGQQFIFTGKTRRKQIVL